MKLDIRRPLLTLVGALGIAVAALGASPWEEVSKAPVGQVERIDAEGGVDITVRDNYLYLTVSKPVTVKVFSILGQLISQETLQPGTRRLRIAARGIYILKIGAVTRRITL